MESAQNVPDVNRHCQSYSENDDWLWWGSPLNQPVLQILVALGFWKKQKKKSIHILAEWFNREANADILSLLIGWKTVGSTADGVTDSTFFYFQWSDCKIAKAVHKWLEPCKVELLLKKMCILNGFSQHEVLLCKGAEWHLVISVSVTARLSFSRSLSLLGRLGSRLCPCRLPSCRAGTVGLVLGVDEAQSSYPISQLFDLQKTNTLQKMLIK